MGKLLISIGRGVLYGLCRLGSGFNKQINSVSRSLEKKPLIATTTTPRNLQVKLLEDGPPPHNHLAIHSTPPKVVVLKVSMHCNGCARKVQKHVSKMEGVISCKVNLDTKMVVVTGDVIPTQVMESLSKVKTAQLWEPTQTDTTDN